MTETTNNLTNKQNLSFEGALVNRLAKEFLAEQIRTRRWGIFFKLLIALYLFLFILMYVNEKMELGELSDEKFTALIDINGVISADAEANADNIVSSLRAAYKNKSMLGLILRINSPGGSPVQAGYINDEIRRLKAENPSISVYAVITDLCASGGYYIAVAADEIYANKASQVGSIGVIMAGFGFVETLNKLGIERRLLYAGESKGFMDSFSPLKEGEIVHVDKMLNGIHQQFIDAVKRGRRGRLKDDDNIFTGLVWTGEQSIELGLVDGLGSSNYVAREIIGAEKIVDFTRRKNYLEQFAESIGASIMNQFFLKLIVN